MTSVTAQKHSCVGKHVEMREALGDTLVSWVMGRAICSYLSDMPVAQTLAFEWSKLEMEASIMLFTRQKDDL
jgi:hypothetical protein